MAILPGTWKPKAQESQFMARLDNFVRLSLKIKDKEKKKKKKQNRGLDESKLTLVTGERLQLMKLHVHKQWQDEAKQDSFLSAHFIISTFLPKQLVSQNLG